MDLQSMLGYGTGSPFISNPYLDIKTPEGLITMENTPIDLMGIDELGNAQLMKAGRKKQYKFPGTMVREIPVGNPYQRGGMTSKQMFDFLFDDKEEEVPNQALPTAPSIEEVDGSDLEMRQRRLAEQENDFMAMQMLEQQGNPYKRTRNPNSRTAANPNFDAEILSSGEFGSQNVGDYGRQIYSQLSQHLGYKPVANSIYRSKEQNDSLPGAVKNSYHLTGNAVDLKPQDWHKLTEEQQLFYRQNYDVVYHNNHYHIEPK